jgi:hypothetical protein
MSTTSKRAGLVLLAALAGMAFLGGGSAQGAGLIDGYVCNGTGKLVATNGHPATWQLTGSGSCLQPQIPYSTGEPRQVTLTGTGTSTSLGLCTKGHLLVENLRIDVDATYTGPASGQTETRHEVWSAPLTLFPIATPTLIAHGGGLGLGVSVALHHVSLSCANNGKNPVAVFAWATL